MNIYPHPNYSTCYAPAPTHGYYYGAPVYTMAPLATPPYTPPSRKVKPVEVDCEPRGEPTGEPTGEPAGEPDTSSQSRQFIYQIRELDARLQHMEARLRQQLQAILYRQRETYLFNQRVMAGGKK